MIVYGFLLDIVDFHDLLLVSGLVLIPLSIISYLVYKEKEDAPIKEALLKTTP
jgi:hypothetical protein